MVQPQGPYRQRAKIVSGFAGIGKSYFVESQIKNNPEFQDIQVQDLDIISFSQLSDGSRNSDFPGNYVSYIRDMAQLVDLLMVSAHPQVLERMAENNLYFTLVYPTMDAKAEYLERYRAGAFPADFINMMEQRWDSFIIRNQKQRNCKHIMLQKGQYLSDLADEIMSPADADEGADEKTPSWDSPTNRDHLLSISNSTHTSVTLNVGNEKIPLGVPPQHLITGDRKMIMVIIVMALLFGILLVLLCATIVSLEQERQIWWRANNASQLYETRFEAPPRSFVDVVEKWVKMERRSRK